MSETATPAERYEIRASSLTSAPSCWRRWAAGNKTLRPLLKKHGHYVGDDKPNAGNVIGSACHEGVGAFLKAKIEGFTADPYEHALKKFRADTKDGFPEDTVSPDATTAEKQITRMVETIMHHADSLKPARVEFKMEARLDQIKPYFMTGHPDIYEENGDFRDMKFGKNCSDYTAQLGGYRLMARSNDMHTNNLFVDWVPRVGLNAKGGQPPLEIIPINPYVAEKAAHSIAEEGMRQIEKFKETGDEWAFIANPNDMLCSKKWCQAYGTSFCKLGIVDK